MIRYCCCTAVFCVSYAMLRYDTIITTHMYDSWARTNGCGFANSHTLSRCAWIAYRHNQIIFLGLYCCFTFQLAECVPPSYCCTFAHVPVLQKTKAAESYVPLIRYEPPQEVVPVAWYLHCYCRKVPAYILKQDFLGKDVAKAIPTPSVALEIRYTISNFDNPSSGVGGWRYVSVLRRCNGRYPTPPIGLHKTVYMQQQYLYLAPTK